LHRRAEVCELALSRAQEVEAVPAKLAAAYVEGMRAAALAAFDYVMIALAWTEADLPAVPEALLVQARLAARSGVGIDTVIRRYIGGHAAFTEAFLRETQEGELSARSVQELLDRQAQAFDRLISTVAREHAQQLNERLSGSETRRLKLVERLLAGNPGDSADLNYELERYHLGLITTGSDTAGALRYLGQHVDRQVLTVRISDYETWAWLGGKRPLGREEFDMALGAAWPRSLPLALGEPSAGFGGWRLSHRQALTAWESRSRGIVRYRDIALTSTILKDDDLVTFLRQSYLLPLREEHRDTLRAYFQKGGNVSSTAAALGVTRQTVTNRLRMAEARLGVQLRDCRTELECALWIQEVRPQSQKL
jgi:hypothetical protein